MSDRLRLSQAKNSLEGMLGCELDSHRFRSNITIAPSVDNKRPFPEDKRVGCLLKFGERDDSARIRVNRKDVQGRSEGVME